MKMKKNRLINIYVISVIVSILMTAGCKGTTGSDEDETKKTAATLSSIAVTTMPDSTSYTVGAAALDTTGLVVIATYSDKTTKNVTSSVSTKGFDSGSAVTSQVITVSYTENSVTATAAFTISIVTQNTATISSISASSAITRYEVGADFNKSAVTISLLYSDSTTSSVSGGTDGVVCSGFDSSSSGTESITFSYAGRTSKISITVYTLDEIVYSKYTTATTNALSSGQAGWGALNCHDPKLFQDDDGTYYVYSTDASIGNAHKTGLQVRSSSDLMNWTCSSSSALQGNWDPDMLITTGETANGTTETLGSNSKYTATTWAPTVIKQNGRYYMFHGIITDNIKGFDSSNIKGPTAWIGLAIADNPEGPFKPAQEYDSSTYKNSTLVRYAWNAPVKGMSAYIGGEMPKMTVNSITTTTSSGTTTDSAAKTLAAAANWYDVSTTAYSGVTGLTGDFTVKYDVTLDDAGSSNWQKWSFALIDNDTKAGWYLRADNWTNDFTASSSVNNNMYGYGSPGSGTNMRVSSTYSFQFTDSTAADYFGNIFSDGAEFIITAAYTASTGTCVVTAASADGSTIYYTATGTGYSGDLRTTNNTASYDTDTGTASSTGWNHGFGSIDPEFVYDVADTSSGAKTPKTYTIGSNTCYAVTFGSWKGGIALVYVDADTLQPVDAGGNIITHPLDEETMSDCFTRIGGGYGGAYEGAQLIYNSDTGYYYLLVSMGELNYEYRVGVGRSSSITGPFLDAGGQSMLLTSTTGSGSRYHAIGSKIIGAAAFDGEYGWRCPGGQSVLRTSDGKIMFACHTRTDFKAGYYFYLQLHQMFFTADGWPVLNQNEYYDDYNGTDEKLASLAMSDIAGTYDTIRTVRGTGKSSYTPYGGTAGTYNTCDETPTASSSLIIASDGTISGTDYSGTVTLGSDGYTVTITLKSADASATYGTFRGYVLNATDWARKGSVARQTITFTTIDCSSGDTSAGEYFFGNKKNY
jgi:beta-xylosidase